MSTWTGVLPEKPTVCLQALQTSASPLKARPDAFRVSLFLACIFVRFACEGPKDFTEQKARKLAEGRKKERKVPGVDRATERKEGNVVKEVGKEAQTQIRKKEREAVQGSAEGKKAGKRVKAGMRNETRKKHT